MSEDPILVNRLSPLYLDVAKAILKNKNALLNLESEEDRITALNIIDSYNSGLEDMRRTKEVFKVQRDLNKLKKQIESEKI